jgi:hypothetical protein
VRLGQSEQVAPVALARHGALGIGRRAEVDERGPVEERGLERGEIRQEAGGGRGRKVDRLRTRGERRGGIALVEGVRHEHGRAGARLALGAKREGGGEEPLARAVQRGDLARRIEAHTVAAAEPAGDRLAQILGALVRRVAAELRRMGGDDLADERRQGVARLADRHDDGLPARRRRVEERAQTGERVIRQVREPLGEGHALSASCAGVFAPPRSWRGV